MIVILMKVLIFKLLQIKKEFSARYGWMFAWMELNGKWTKPWGRTEGSRPRYYEFKCSSRQNIIY